MLHSINVLKHVKMYMEVIVIIRLRYVILQIPISIHYGSTCLDFISISKVPSFDQLKEKLHILEFCKFSANDNIVSVHLFSNTSIINLFIILYLNMLYTIFLHLSRFYIDHTRKWSMNWILKSGMKYNLSGISDIFIR